jgi:hypothetical protein
MDSLFRAFSNSIQICLWFGALSSYFFPQISLAQSCDAFAPLLRSESALHPSTTEGVQQRQRARISATQESIKLLFLNYIGNKESNFSSADCGLNSESQKLFSYYFAPTFFKASRINLEGLGDKYISKLFSLQDKVFGVNEIPPVRFVVEGRNSKDPQLVAGVARGTKLLFASVLEIPPEEWNMILVHEIAHIVDDALDAAVKQWQSNDLKEKALAERENFLQSSPIRIDDFPNSRVWLSAGLNRGFLAEYRAWVITSVIYESLRAKSLQVDLNWMREISAAGMTISELKVRVFKYLDSRFFDSVENTESNILNKPPFANILQILRQELRYSAKTEGPPLYGLNSIFESSAK